jgi:hypothetical protein
MKPMMPSSVMKPVSTTPEQRSQHRWERRERRCSVLLSFRLCLGVMRAHGETRVDRILHAVPHSESFVWTDPMEVREEGGPLRVLLALRSVYPLRLRQRGLCFLPGMRPHEHRSFRRWRRRCRRRGLLSMGFAIGWWIPNRWTFFTSFSDQWAGEDRGLPRRKTYFQWWRLGLRRGFLRLHRPRRRRRRARWGTNREMRDRLVALRRPLIFLAFLLGARITPPDIFSQLRVAIPLVRRRERWIRCMCFQDALLRSDAREGW